MKLVKNKIIIELSLFFVVFCLYILAGNHYMSDGRYTLAIAEQIYNQNEIKVEIIIKADENSNKFPRNIAYFGIVDVVEYPVIFNLINELKKLGVAPRPFSTDSTFYSASDFFNIINELSPDTKTEDIKVQPTFPIWASIYSIPAVIVFNAFGLEGFSGDKFDINNNFQMQMILAALFCAVSSIFLFKTSKLINNKFLPYFIFIWFSMASPIVSELSKTLWHDTIAIMFLSSAIYLIVASLYSHKKFIGWEVIVGILLASCFMIKPTYFFITSVYSVVLIFDRNMLRQEKIYYIITIIVMAIIFFGVNKFLFNSLIQEYFTPSRVGNFKLENLYGLMFSPGRGIIWFMPSWIIVFSCSIFLIFKSVENNFFRNFLIGNVIIIMIGIFSVSGFHPWWGGASFGSRILYFLLPVIFFTMQIILHEQKEDYPSYYRGHKKKAILAILMLCLIWEGFVHMGESLSGYGQAWNVRLATDETTLDHLWDWSHPQFLASAMSL